MPASLQSLWPNVRPQGVLAAAAVFLAAALGAAPAHAGPTLEAIEKRGLIKAGVGSQPGFFAPDSSGRWQGFWIDIGRAIAITTLGDPEKIQFVSSSPQQRLPALKSGEFDILLSGVTQTITRATQHGFHFGPVAFYDGQGLLVPKKLGVAAPKDLDGATVCIQTGTTGEQNIADFFRKSGATFKPVTIEDTSEFLKAFEAGRCDVLTQDGSDLGIKRTQLRQPDDYVILPERISKEPLAPAVRYGDDRWLELVNWSVYALIQAEELGITSQNVDTFLDSSDPEIRRFLGVDLSLGLSTGLDPKFAYKIVKTLGNYGEVFDRNVGPTTRIGFQRGLNRLWTAGGLLYAPPFR
ncbi:amino acid ABC transporter substrate-binding protein [Methylopila sp. M107]|uniref:amino acid ABC transporter substrate-binding protein n=1 Tax=Methylopila sp. M107 TaxID=1101190 RepID=UPI0003A27D5D|nr:amino acid ABC transporter substrate-binding protein [Methylopila sp. M107]